MTGFVVQGHKCDLDGTEFNSNFQRSCVKNLVLMSKTVILSSDQAKGDFESDVDLWYCWVRGEDVTCPGCFDFVMK